MPRLLIPLLAAAFAAPAILAPAAFAEAGGAPPQQIPIQLTPPKTNVTIRTITLDAAGAVSADSQKVLDQMVDDGWRAMSITTVSSGQPVTLAMLFARPSRPPGPPPGAAPAPAPAPAVAAPHPPAAGTPPPPSNEHNP